MVVHWRESCFIVWNVPAEVITASIMDERRVNPIPRPAGWVHVVIGPMFSGKTETLIHLAEQHPPESRAVFKHASDTRYDPQRVVSHAGTVLDATAASDASTLVDLIPAGASFVAIDECQFFGIGLVVVVESLAERGIGVLIVGLDLDSWANAFPVMDALAERADEVTRRSAVCAGCGRVARFTQRVAPIVDGNMIGGSESFEPRCQACWTPPEQAVVEAPLRIDASYRTDLR